MNRKKHPSKVRSKQIIAKVTPAEHAAIVKAAKQANMTISEYLRWFALGV